ncbi:ParB/RepB/Spo0J family partition protein, partial [Streptomyces xiamenensis]|uniref:ParB/RepB/Spo0J family partition protein n=1 Tax=Streptomyces xiamenensis TaxID=408015 RepID=UPI0035D8B003
PVAAAALEVADQVVAADAERAARGEDEQESGDGPAYEDGERNGQEAPATAEDGATNAPQAEDAEDTSDAEKAVLLLLIDPRTESDTEDEQASRVIVDPFNHRKRRTEGDDTEPDAALIASVGAVGVQQCPVLRPQTGDNAGKLGIVIGQRRMKAARQAAELAKAEGHEYLKVRVIVRDDLTGADDEVIAASMAENIHRRAASAQDDVEAAQQLAFMVEAKRVPKARKERLARAVGRSVEELDAARQVAKMAPEVIEELAEDDVEFDWVELADYDTVRGVDGALWTLENAKRQDATAKNTNRGAWRQALAALKVKAAQIERLAAIRAELAEKKIPEVSHRYSWEYTSARPLDDLVSGIGRTLREKGQA